MTAPRTARSRSGCARTSLARTALLLSLSLLLGAFGVACGSSGDDGGDDDGVDASFFFDRSPTSLTVDFTSTSTPMSGSWDFGDGSAAVVDDAPSHTYAEQGSYDVTLTVDDGTTSESVTLTVDVEIDFALRRTEQLSESESFGVQGLLPPTPSDDCDVTLQPGAPGVAVDDSVALNTAIEDASSGDVICLAPGDYVMGSTIEVSSVQNLALKGIGAAITDVVLDFDDLSVGEGVNVTTAGFWIENMAIKNTPENGIEVKAVNTPELPNVFRKLLVFWDNCPVDEQEDGICSVTENGAYSVYPTRSSNVVVEFCEVSGASDAGLYIGQVEHGIVRYNEVYGNVAGLEVENSFDVVVYGNEVYDNTGGILALQEDGLTRLTNEQVLIHDNEVMDNNRDNFARPGSTVSNVPRGTGLMAFAGRDIEFRDNDVMGNGSVGLLIVGNRTLEAIGGNTDPMFSPGYDPFSANIFANGNAFVDNGLDPLEGPGFLDAIRLATGVFDIPTIKQMIADNPVIWDADVEDPDQNPNICVGAVGGPSVLQLGGNNFSRACDLPELDLDPLNPVVSTGALGSLTFTGSDTADFGTSFVPTIFASGGGGGAFSANWSQTVSGPPSRSTVLALSTFDDDLLSATVAVSETDLTGGTPQVTTYSYFVDCFSDPGDCSGIDLDVSGGTLDFDDVEMGVSPTVPGGNTASGPLTLDGVLLLEDE